MSRLNNRRPDLYRSKTCIRCNESEEDTEHIFNCSKNPFNTTEYVLDTFSETISEHTKTKKETIDQWKTSLKSHTKTKWCHLIITGLIPYELKKQISTWSKNNKTTTNVLRESLNTIRHTLLHLWDLRCNQVNKWEQKNKITNKMKRDRTKWHNLSLKKNINTIKSIIKKTMKTQISFLNIFHFVYKDIIDNVNTSSA
jgi:hypothetical protein